MERIFLREKIEETNIYTREKQKIGVVGMNRGVGTSFVTTSIAKFLSETDAMRVTFLEVCDRINEKKSLVYDAIGIDKRFKARDFVRFYNDVKTGNTIKGKSNFDEKINWAIITPEDIKNEIELTPIEMMRLINNVSGDAIVCDISDCKSAVDFLLDMDSIVFVIDPSPTAMISGYPLMREVKRLEHNGAKVAWVINKFNAGIHKRDMQNFLKLKEFYKIPAMNFDDFYSAEYNCKLPYEIPDIRKQSSEIFSEILLKKFKMF